MSGDGKYEARGNQIVKRTTGEPIPDDEPVFILRARDKHAVATLVSYLGHCQRGPTTEYHLQGIDKAVAAFEAFRRNNPDQMKVPGITGGK
jgi:hypothetical protein